MWWMSILSTRIGIGGLCLVVGWTAGIMRTEWKYHEMRVAESARSELIAEANLEFQRGQAKMLRSKSDERKRVVDEIINKPRDDRSCGIGTDRLRSIK